MKKTVIKGILQTLILLIALFLIGMEFMQYMMVVESVLLEDETLSSQFSDDDREAISETNKNVAESQTLRDQILRWISETPEASGYLYAGMFLLIALSLLPDCLPWRDQPRSTRIRTLFSGVLILAVTAVFLILGYCVESVTVMTVLYTLVLIVESVLKLKEKHTAGRLAMRIILIIVALLNLVFLHFFPYFVLALIIVRSLKQILTISFSQIRMDILRKIIRKTYASEILLGLILLIVAFSLVLSMIDPNIEDFGSALWYCFAIVTTIGFGDVTAGSLTGRIISVILGIYGIIVVALITSVIVNFYNEVKSENEEKETAPDLSDPARLP